MPGRIFNSTGVKAVPTTGRIQGQTSTSTAPVGRITKTKPIEETVQRKTLPTFLGGGSYNSVKGQPNKLVNTPGKSQDALPASKDTERHHIVPDSLGGLSEGYNLIPLSDKEHKKVTTVGSRALNDYNAGKISLAEARLKTQTELQTILAEREGISTSVLKNYPKALLDTAKNGAKGLLNILISSEKKAANQIGSALASVSPEYKKAVKAQQDLDTMNLQLAKKIGQAQKEGKDTTRLLKQLASNNGNRYDAKDLIPELGRTPLQEIADWAGVGIDVLTAGVGSQVAKGAKPATVVAKKIGSKIVKESAALGAGYGATGYFQDTEKPTIGGALLSTAAGAAGGAILAKGGQLLGRIGKAVENKSIAATEKASTATDTVIDKVLGKTSKPSALNETNQIGAVLTEPAAVKGPFMQDIIPPTSKTAQSTPIKLAEGTKTSKFAQGVAGSEKTTKEVSESLINNPPTYEVQHNPEVKAKAIERVKTNAAEAENFVLNETKPSAEHTATAIELIKKMQDEGNHAGAVRIAEDVSQKLTKAGQAVQAAKLYENLSPESILVKAKTFIRKENEKANIFQKKKELTEEDAQALYETAKKMQEATGDAKSELSNEIASILADYQHNTVGKKVSSIQTQAQLLNPKTQVRNVLGNEIFYRMERLSKLIAMPFDIARSKLTSTERTITMKTGNQGQYWSDWLKGAKAGWKGIQLGPDTQFQLPNKTFNNKWNPFYWGERAVGASLKSFDYAAYNRARLQTLYEFGYLRAKREGASGAGLKELAKKYAANAETQVLEIADQYGKYITFQDDNVISRMAIGLKKGLNVGKDFGLGDLVLKYPKTPGALLARALEYSPAGFLKSAYQIAQPIIMGRAKSAAENKELAMAVSRSIIGTLGFTGLGYYFADKGFITGRKSKDKDVASMQQSIGQGKYQMNLSAIKRWVLSGFKNTTTKAGDFLYTYDWAQPLAVSLSVGANMNSGKGETAAGIGESLSSGASTIAEQPLLTGLTRLFQYGDPVAGVQSVAEGALSSFTPTVANQFRQFLDNQSRNTEGDTGLQTALNLSKNKIPGLEKDLAPKYDVTGQPVKNFESPNIFQIFFSPGTQSTLKENPASKLVLDLMESTGETKQIPRVIAKEVTLFGEKIKLTPEEYAAMQKYAGERTMKGLETLLTQEKFNELDDTDKVKAISNNLSDVGAGVKALIQAKKLIDLNASDQQDKIEELTKDLKASEMKMIQNAINYLKANPGTFEVDKNPLPEEPKKEKKSSSMLEGGGMVLAGLGLSAITKGKGNKLVTKGIDKVLAKEGTKLAEKAIAKEGELLAIHSTTEEALKSIIKEGQIHAPSVGIVKKAFGEAPTFGRYKLVINKEAINPAKSDVFVYSDDVYSPRISGKKEDVEKLMKNLAEKGEIVGGEVGGREKAPTQVSFAKRILSFDQLRKEASENIVDRKASYDEYNKRSKELADVFEDIMPAEALEALGKEANDFIENVSTEATKKIAHLKIFDKPAEISKMLSRDFDIHVGEKTARELSDSINNIFNKIKVEYFEAKPMKSIDFAKDVDAVILPTDADVDLIYELKQAGKTVHFYDPKSFQYNQFSDVKDPLSLKAVFQKVSQSAFAIGIVPASKNVFKDNPYNSKIDKEVDKSVSESKDPVVKRLSIPTKGEGTYYDPNDANQTKANPDGKGAYGRMIESGSIAFGNRYFHEDLKDGKLIYVKIKELESVKTPYGNGIFRIDDTMNKRYNVKGQFNIDFNHTDKLPDALRKKGRFPLTFKVVKIEDPAK